MYFVFGEHSRESTPEILILVTDAETCRNTKKEGENRREQMIY